MSGWRQVSHQKKENGTMNASTAIQSNISGRRSRRRRLCLVLIAAVLGTMVSGIARAKEPAKPKRGKPASTLKDEHFATPEVTFKTAQDALARKKYGDFTRCLSDDGLSEMAGTMRLLAAMMASFPSDPNTEPAMAKSLKSMKMALDKYVPADAEPGAINFDASEAEHRAALRKAGGAVKDRASFIAAVFKSLSEAGPTEKGKGPLVGAELLGLKIDNDTATATASKGVMDDAPMPVTFRRIKGRWKIDTMGSVEATSGEKPSP
jgi:hypothetical protein